MGGTEYNKEKKRTKKNHVYVCMVLGDESKWLNAYQEDLCVGNVSWKHKELVLLS